VIEAVYSAIISRIWDEALLINDKLCDELGLILLSVGKGLWRFSDDPASVVRESEKPVYWSS